MQRMIDEQTQPTIGTDGTITAIVAAPPYIVRGSLQLALALPKRLDAECAAGRFILARCGAQSAAERATQWSIYLRRPLYVAARPQRGTADDQSIWQFCAPLLPAAHPTTFTSVHSASSMPPNAAEIDDAGYAWLAQRQTGEVLNLTGPYGNSFPLPSLVRRLLLLADPARLSLLVPLIDAALDRGGQVSLLLLAEHSGLVAVEAMRASLPLSVELHTLEAAAWPGGGLAANLRWADQLCVALTPQHLPPVAEAIRQARLRFESGFAFALIEADLACGYGACLACVVPLANGSLTRACVHGPVFDLLELAGKG